MPTPTFPEPLLNDEEAVVETPPPPFAETVANIRAGPVRAVDVARLSDLSREDARLLARIWPALPEQSRVAIVREMDSLAEERVDLIFGRALRIALADDSAVVRQVAVAALWEDDRADLLEMLLEMVTDDPSQDVRAEAARTIGPFAERAVAGDLDEDLAERLRLTLIELAADDTTPYGVRRQALESVGVFGREDDVRACILDAYESDDQGLQASALYAMGRSLDSRWLGTVMDELRSPEAELRYDAARAAGFLGDDRVVPDLSQLSLDADDEVRHAAIAALGEIGGRAAVRVLLELAEDASPADLELIEAAVEEAASATEPLRVGGGA